jgi:U3 small nucleolar RNA-associated protein 25
MAIDDGTNPTTKLLTLLNVSATKVNKRKRPVDDYVPAEKLNKRKTISFSETVSVKVLDGSPSKNDRPSVATVELVEEDTAVNDDSENQAGVFCPPQYRYSQS